MNDMLVATLSPIISGIVLAIIIYWFKIPYLLKENTSAINLLTIRMQEIVMNIDLAHRKLDLHEKQLGISQRLFSDILDHPIDTAKIAEDASQYPHNHIFRSVKRRDS